MRYCCATWPTSPGSSRPGCIRTRSSTVTSSPRLHTRRLRGPVPASFFAPRRTHRQSTVPSSREYQGQVRKNADVLAETLQEGGLEVLTGGTDTHLLQLDLRSTEWTGKDAEERLAEVKLTVNRNTVPFDERPPTV